MAEIIPIEPDKVMLDWDKLWYFSNFLGALRIYGGFFMFQNSILTTATWYLFKFDTPLNAVKTISIWLFLALVITILLVTILLRKEKRKRFLKVSLTVSLIYACVLALIFLIFTFIDNVNDGVFIGLLVFPLSLLIIATVFSVILTVYKKGRKTQIVSALSIGVSLIIVLVSMGIRFIVGESSSLNGLDKSDVNSVFLYISATLLFLGIIFTAILFDREKISFDTKSITYAGTCVAMSFALSYLRIVKMPQGGSITLASLLPLMIYSYIFGVKKGVIVGMVYGLLQALQDPYIIHPAQFLLDYPIAFGGIGLSGIFSKNKKLEKAPQVKFLLGGLLGGVSRFSAHFLAGSFAFSAFAGDQNPFLYSFIYQAGYVLPDLAIVIVIGTIVFSSKSFLKLVLEKSN